MSFPLVDGSLRKRPTRGLTNNAGAETHRRFKNVSSLHAYARALAEGRLPIEWEETLSGEQDAIEKWMLALRLDDGFPRAWLDSEKRVRVSQSCEQAGYLEPHPSIPDRLRLTARGFALSDQLVAQFI